MIKESKRRHEFSPKGEKRWSEYSRHVLEDSGTMRPLFIDGLGGVVRDRSHSLFRIRDFGVQRHEHARDLVAQIGGVTFCAHIDRNEREEILLELLSSFVHESRQGAARGRHHEVRDAYSSRLRGAFHVGQAEPSYAETSFQCPRRR